VQSWGKHHPPPPPFVARLGRLTNFRIYTCALSSGVSGGIIVSGLISINYQWRYIYWVSTALIGTCTLLVIFTFPETMYRRDEVIKPSHAPVDSATVEVGTKDAAKPHDAADAEKAVDSPVRYNHLEKRSYVSSLRLFSGTYTKESFITLFLRPIVLLTLPSVLWATLVMSGTIGFLVAITSNFAPAFAQAYGFEPWQSGLCFFAALIGAFIGILFGGHLSDWIADRETVRNGGLREPEMRLPAIMISIVTAPLALVLYGVGINNQLHWICPTIGLLLSKLTLPKQPFVYLSGSDC
jgi:MFS family permease